MAETVSLPPREAPASTAPLPDDRLSGIAALTKRDDYYKKHAERRREAEGRKLEARGTEATNFALGEW